MNILKLSNIKCYNCNENIDEIDFDAEFNEKVQLRCCCAMGHPKEKLIEHYNKGMIDAGVCKKCVKKTLYKHFTFAKKMIEFSRKN